MTRGTRSLRRRTWPVPAVIAAASLGIAGSILAAGPSDALPGSTPSPTAAPLPMPTAVAKPDLSRHERHDTADPLAEGDASAPVTLVVYTDFQCTYCARWHAQSLPELRRDYVDTGRVRIETRNIAVYGPDSRRGAEAVHAAALQKKGREFADALFASGRPATHDALSETSLIATAGSVGLDVARFTADLRSTKVRELAGKDIREAEGLGIFATPAFLVAGEPMVGAQPTAVFREKLDAALAKQGG